MHVSTSSIRYIRRFQLMFACIAATCVPVLRPSGQARELNKLFEVNRGLFLMFKSLSFLEAALLKDGESFRLG